jgi:ABC-type multidrug transport system permease subunit
LVLTVQLVKNGRLDGFIRAWADATPMKSRQLWVWTMTPAFGVVTLVGALDQMWTVAVFGGLATAFGIWRWWRLPKRWGG